MLFKVVMTKNGKEETTFVSSPSRSAVQQFATDQAISYGCDEWLVEGGRYLTC